MKPFKINRNSWHYKLNKNFFNDSNMQYGWEPKHNNFCSYWRATMFRVLGAGFLSSIVIGMFTILGVIAYTEPVTFLAVIGSILGLILFICGIAFILHIIESRKKANADKPDSLFMQKYKAHKSKICPMVEYDS
jgi:hypothetical protein